MEKKILIGVASGKITPNGKIALCGQFHTRISTHVESDIYANCVAFDSGENQLIICSLDLEGIGISTYRRIGELVEAQCPEIDADAMILCCTHIHTGPFGGGVGGDHEEYPGLHAALHFLPEGYTFRDYEWEARGEGVLDTDEAVEQVAQAAAKVIVEAWEKRAPGFFGPAFGRAVLAHQRRVVYNDGTAAMYGNTWTSTFDRMEGGTDTGVELLYLFNAEEKPIGVLANIPCPSQVVEMACYVSSDYWGKARDILQEKLGEDFVTISMCAPAGDLSVRDQVRLDRAAVGQAPGAKNRPRREDAQIMSDIRGAKELGRRVANVVLEKLEEGLANKKNSGFLETRIVHLDLPVRKVTPTEYKEAKRSFKTALEELGTTELTPWTIAAVHVQGGTMHRYQIQERSHIFPTDIVISRLDDMAFATSPFELFLDFGNRIRARSWAAQTFLAQLSNDEAGYLPSALAEKGGHYSAYVSSGIVGHEGGDILVEKTVSVINELFSEE